MNLHKYMEPWSQMVSKTATGKSAGPDAFGHCGCKRVIPSLKEEVLSITQGQTIDAPGCCGWESMIPGVEEEVSPYTLNPKP